MKRVIAALLLAALMSGFAWAEEEMPISEALTDEQATQIVEALFAAAAGTTEDAEKVCASTLSAEEYDEHRLELAAYRAQMLPWLSLAFVPEEDETLSEESATMVSAEKESLRSEKKTAMETEGFDGVAKSAGEHEGSEGAADEALEYWSVESAYVALQGTETGRAYLEILDGYGCVGAEDCLETTNEACRIWMNQIDAETLKATNGDYACWLYCPESPIDYPVVQGADNSKYLKRLFDGTRNACGTLFIDYRNLPAFQDPNTLIYGHHMRNGSMFKSITYYAEQSWYESHPFMLVISESEIAVLEVLAGYLTDKNDHCYDVAISDDEDLLAFVAQAREKSDFETAADAEAGDRLITLSTCAYAFRNARYILIARMETVWQNPDVIPELMAQYQAKRAN